MARAEGELLGEGRCRGQLGIGEGPEGPEECISRPEGGARVGERRELHLLVRALGHRGGEGRARVSENGRVAIGDQERAPKLFCMGTSQVCFSSPAFFFYFSFAAASSTASPPPPAFSASPSRAAEALYAFDLCLGSNLNPRGAGPRSISLIFTQSWGSVEASSVSRSSRPL